MRPTIGNLAYETGRVRSDGTARCFRSRSMGIRQRILSSPGRTQADIFISGQAFLPDLNNALVYPCPNRPEMSKYIGLPILGLNMTEAEFGRLDSGD